MGNGVSLKCPKNRKVYIILTLKKEMKKKFWI